MNYLIKILHVIYGFALILFVNRVEYTWIETYVASFLFFIFIIDNIFNKKMIVIPKLIYPFLFFILISFIGLISNQVDSTLNVLLLFIKILCFIVVLYNQIITINSFNFLFFGIVIGLLVNIYIGYFISDDFFMLTSKRYSGSLMNPNHYSFLLSVAIAFFIYLIFNIKQKSKINSIIKFIIILFMLLFAYEIIYKTASRQGFLLVVFCFLFYLYRVYKNLNFFRVIAVLFISIFIIDIALEELNNYSFLKERVFSILSFNRNTDISISQRFNYITKAFEFWLENPLFGIGLDQFRVLNNSSYSHNNYLELLATTGLFGFISYYFSHFLILKIYFSSKKYKSNLDYSIFLLLLILASDISSVNYIEKPYWLIFTVILFISSKFSVKKSNRIIKF